MKKILIVLFIIAFLTPVAVYAEESQQNSDHSASGEGYNPQYNVLPIIVGWLILYLATYLLFDAKYIKMITFKQIWSVILIGSFLFSGFSGIILALLSDYNLQFPCDFNLLFWHVELSVTMAIALILHLHIHWKPLKMILEASV